jgi:hypothetical protein
MGVVALVLFMYLRPSKSGTRVPVESIESIDSIGSIGSIGQRIYPGVERLMPMPMPVEQSIFPPGEQRTFPMPTRVPINTPTRGENTGYQQVGILIEDDSSDGTKKILPLYGEQTYRGSNNWRYYTSTDGFQSVKLPVLHKNKNCQEEYGCDEIYDGTSIRVMAYEKPYTASLYKLDGPRYLPGV